MLIKNPFSDSNWSFLEINRILDKRKTNNSRDSHSVTLYKEGRKVFNFWKRVPPGVFYFILLQHLISNHKITTTIISPPLFCHPYFKVEMSHIFKDIFFPPHWQGERFWENFGLFFFLVIVIDITDTLQKHHFSL